MIGISVDGKNVSLPTCSRASSKVKSNGCHRRKPSVNVHPWALHCPAIQENTHLPKDPWLLLYFLCWVGSQGNTFKALEDKEQSWEWDFTEQPRGFRQPLMCKADGITTRVMGAKPPLCIMAGGEGASGRQTPSWRAGVTVTAQGWSRWGQ